MAQTNNGFVIAEKDLELRGPGEVLGTKQSGEAEFRIGNLVRDQLILDRARRAAEYYLTNKKDSQATKKLIERVIKEPRFGLGNIG